MLPRVILRTAVQAGQVHRHLSASAVLCRPDPIQQLFVDKIRDYAKQSKAAGGKLVGVTPDVEKSLADMLENLDKQYGATGPDFMKFPTFTFTDQALEDPGINVRVNVEIQAEETAADEVVKELDKPYWED